MQYLNVLFVFPGEIKPGTFEFRYPKRMARVLNKQDVYKLNICITGKDHAFAEIDIKTQIGEDWRRPKILELCSE